MSRGVSSVIGVILMVALTIILASIISVFFFGFENFHKPSYYDELNQDGHIEWHKTDLIYAKNDEPNHVNSKYYVYYQFPDDSPSIGNSLNKVKVKYPSGFSAIETAKSKSNIIAIGFDTDEDGVIETSVKNDIDTLKTTDKGTNLVIGFSGNYNINKEPNDTLIIKFEGISNPSTGEYTVPIRVNGETIQKGTVKIS